MTPHVPARIGLIGTITRDRIVHEGGAAVDGIGGVLYQAAALSGLGEEVFVHGNCGHDLVSEIDRLAADWPGFRTEGICYVPQPANRVHLEYPIEGEPVEILEWAVPPFKLSPIPADAAQWEALLFVLNSGFDMILQDWRRIVAAVSCPAWLDIHSLVLEPALGRPRSFRAVPDWMAWVRGVAWLQANARGVACLDGHPDRLPSDGEILDFARRVFDLGVRAVFVTKRTGGAMVLTPGQSKHVTAPAAGPAVDATGCGDVFAAAAISRLVRGASPFEAASFGTVLASNAAFVSGVREIWKIAAAHGRGQRPGPPAPPSAQEE
jgi:hypothetical protein